MTALNFFEPQGFELVHDGNVLAALPATLGFRAPLGRSDPYTWERAPGSTVWFPLGDGLPRERPTLNISGTWMYQTDDAAMQAASEIHRACRLADAVNFRGRNLARLQPALPGTCQATHGARYREVTYEITLNLTVPLDPERIQEVQQT